MRVTLVGSGPGDIGLMTVRGVERLQEADVVLYDRLIGDGLLRLIPDGAEKINVGKNTNDHPVPQDEINRILVAKAKQGLRVVRLKGGDPFVFGRGGEELEALAEQGIPFEVVPGISSSIAAAAYAGIPVTHRDYTSSLHIITGHGKKNSDPDINFEALVKLNGTLVFMMSVASLAYICEECVAAGMDSATPAAIIENATRSRQRKFLGTLATLPGIARENDVVSPSVIIIGKVCELSDKLDWFSARPLSGRRVIVTRSRETLSSLTAPLRELGAEVIETPCIRIRPLLDDNEPLRRAVANLDGFGWLVFTSAVGVRLFFEYLARQKRDIRALRHLKIAAVGTETEKEINRRGIFVDYVPDVYSGEELAKGLVGIVAKGEAVLLARAKMGSEDILDIFKGAGVAFENVSLYDTEHEVPEETPHAPCEADLIAFTSSSTVKGFVKLNPNADYGKLRGVCIGEKTAEAARRYGFSVAVSERASIASLIEKITEVAAGGERARNHEETLYNRRGCRRG